VIPEHTQPSTALTRMVDLTDLGDDVFEGTPVPMLRGSMFGGQILGQCWTAAHESALGHPWPVSLHAFFVSAPDPSSVVTYTVERQRESRRYAWRRVVGVQHGSVVVDALVALSALPPTAFETALPPGIRGPDELDPPDLVAGRDPEVVGDYFDHVSMGVLDVRYVDGPPPVRIRDRDLAAEQWLWVRPLSPVAGAEVGAVLALLSDVNLLATPLMTMGELGDGVTTYAASFDHDLRFYAAPAEVDWLLFHQEAVVVAGSTVESRARVLAPDGTLVLTVTQQGLVLRR
jgi:acyl-CoA thioesterase II